MCIQENNKRKAKRKTQKNIFLNIQSSSLHFGTKVEDAAVLHIPFFSAEAFRRNVNSGSGNKVLKPKPPALQLTTFNYLFLEEEF